MSKLPYYSIINSPKNYNVSFEYCENDENAPTLKDSSMGFKDVNDYILNMKKELNNIFSDYLLNSLDSMLIIEGSDSFSKSVFEKFELSSIIKKIDNDNWLNKNNLKKVIDGYNQTIRLISENLKKLNNNALMYNTLLQRKYNSETRYDKYLKEGKDIEAMQESVNIHKLKSELDKYKKIDDIFEKFSFVPTSISDKLGEKFNFQIDEIKKKYKGEGVFFTSDDFKYSPVNKDECVSYCTDIIKWLERCISDVDKFPNCISFNFEDPPLSVDNIVKYSETIHALSSLISVTLWVKNVCNEVGELIKKYNTETSIIKKTKIKAFLKDDIFKYSFIIDKNNNFETIINSYLDSESTSFSQFIQSEEGIQSAVIDMDKFFEDVGNTGSVMSFSYVMSRLSELVDSVTDEVKEVVEEIETEETEEIVDPEPNPKSDPNPDPVYRQPRRTDDTGSDDYTPGSSSSDSSSSSSSSDSSSSSEDISKKPEEETIVVPPSDDKKEEPQNEVKPEDHGSEVYVDPQPEPSNPVVEPTKFVPQNESSYHGGGGYSSEGYVSTTTDESPIEEIIDDSPTSLEDVIKDNGIYPEIPRKIPIENHGTAKSSGSNVIPIVAGLTSVGAAGLGSKAYLDHKRNNSDNDEYDEADEYEDYDETPEEVDADVIINDNPDSDLNPLNNNDNNNEVTFDEDDYS